ncbi:ATP-dependent RNA helicase ddx54 [Entophlyctis sp. JEL0112]|nr:ATP-dependent RNA helicase ddx54 [Entophlyctis sp. JEL0112]
MAVKTQRAGTAGGKNKAKPHKAKGGRGRGRAASAPTAFKGKGGSNGTAKGGKSAAQHRPRYEDLQQKPAASARDKKNSKITRGAPPSTTSTPKPGRARHAKNRSNRVDDPAEDTFETVPRTVDENDGWDSDADEVRDSDDEISESRSDDSEHPGTTNDATEGSNTDDGVLESENEDSDQHSVDESDDNAREEADDDSMHITKSVQLANKRHKKSGGFQSMGLSYPIYSAIIQKGYKIPTPIQRKAIPVILENRDVVAMARTGSGKTAAFLIPLLEKLKTHSAKVGARGLILSPSRELALQTLRFIKDIGKHTDLRACMLVGGGTMDEQFATLATNPDIIIATPGRLMHLIIEMNLDLRTVEYVVFDEADRLFEMGFAEQLREILFKLPESRQTLLFSATLPKLLVEFAKAGLSDPALIRLDADTKISTDLQLLFFSMKAEEKDAALLYLLNTVIPSDQQTIIFAATKHVVEYLHELLNACGIQSTYIFGSLDQVARTMHINKFRNGLAKILIVTDVAARGIDIPLLDNVINYDFPGSSKVLIHRVGRVGRAGRKGMAFSFVSGDEIFSGRPLLYSTIFDGTNPDMEPTYTRDIILGEIPPGALEMDREQVAIRTKESVVLQTLSASVANSLKKYLRTRGNAGRESYTRAKAVLGDVLGVHPYLRQFVGDSEVKRKSILDEISRFRPAETVFEFKKGTKDSEALLMQARRHQVGRHISISRNSRAEAELKTLDGQRRAVLGSSAGADVSESYLKDTFKSIDDGSKKRKRSATDSFKDNEFYMSHYQKDAATEKGYSLSNTVSSSTGRSDNFTERASEVTVDVTADDEDGLKSKKSGLVWDKKKKAFVKHTVGADNKKRMRTESGASVLASYKSGRFEQWQKKTNIRLPLIGEQELNIGSSGVEGVVNPFERKYRHNKVVAANPKSKSFQRRLAAAEAAARKSGADPAAARQSLLDANSSRDSPTPKNARKPKSELKTEAQIAKERREKQKRREKTGRHAHIVGKGGKANKFGSRMKTGGKKK